MNYNMRARLYLCMNYLYDNSNSNLLSVLLMRYRSGRPSNQPYVGSSVAPRWAGSTLAAAGVHSVRPLRSACCVVCNDIRSLTEPTGSEKYNSVGERFYKSWSVSYMYFMTALLPNKVAV